MQTCKRCLLMFVNAMLYLSACITITVFMAGITSTERAEDAGGGAEDGDGDEKEAEDEDGDAPRGRAAPRVW